MSAQPTRRLAAVMLADVAGYSRLMEQDESGTHSQLRLIRQRITEPEVERYRGRLVRSKGDDMLVEFGSATDALACALSIQQMMRDRNRDIARDARIEFRIGINLGDILIDADEIAGEGVNLAARLETLAAPGGITLSQAVHDQVRQMDGVRLVDTGLHRVKNMVRPVRVFAAVSGPSRPRLSSPLLQRVAVRRLMWFLVALAAAASAWWLAATPGSTRVEAPEQSIAVLPPAAQPEVRAAALRLGEDLSAAMSRALPGSVTAFSTASGVASRSADPRAAGEAMNVRYIIESDVVAYPSTLRVTVRLLSSDSGLQLWSTTIESDRTPDGATPLPVLVQLIDALTVEIDRADLARHKASGAPPSAYALTLQAKQLLRLAITDAELGEVQGLLDRAVALDADHGGALQWLAATLLARADRTVHAPEAETLYQRAEETSMRAVIAAPTDPQAWKIRANVLMLRRKTAAASEAIDRALALNPADQMIHGQRGSLLQSLGQQQEAIAEFNHAISLNPGSENVGLHLHNRCTSELLLGRYADAIDSCTRGLAHGPDWPDHMLLVAAHALAGNRKSALEARAELLRIQPGFRVSRIEGRLDTLPQTARRQYEQQLVRGLRAAGLPD
jgi:class 3 adenylate cyclase/tetratricopeptide (TPR) repeat protein